jgi:hypothetical protein
MAGQSAPLLFKDPFLALRQPQVLVLLLMRLVFFKKVH